MVSICVLLIPFSCSYSCFSFYFFSCPLFFSLHFCFLFSVSLLHPFSIFNPPPSLLYLIHLSFPLFSLSLFVFSPSLYILITFPFHPFIAIPSSRHILSLSSFALLYSFYMHSFFFVFFVCLHFFLFSFISISLLFLSHMLFLSPFFFASQPFPCRYHFSPLPLSYFSSVLPY